MWFYWTCTAAVTAVCAWLALQWWHIYSALRLVRRITTKLGMVKLTERDIRQVGGRLRKQATLALFPTHLWRYIHRYNEAELGRYTMEAITKEVSSERQDIHRAITLAAAMYGFTIPSRILQLDGRTVALHARLSHEHRLLYVSDQQLHKDTDKQNALLSSPTMTQILVARYCAQLPRIATVIMYYAAQGAYPSLEVFTKTFNASVKRLKKDNEFETAEVKYMVSAYAILTMCKIPASYVLVNSITLAIVNRNTRVPQEEFTVTV